MKFTWSCFELEADPRHSQMIVELLGVSRSGGITTAGCQNEEIERPEQEEKLPVGDVIIIRKVSGRANYLALARFEMLHASKEVCREMSQPSVGGLEKITRFGGCLAAKPRVLW